MDADVAVKHLGCHAMRGELAHSGFPEIGYMKYASILVNKGYKVLRVEQTETPEMNKARNAIKAKGDKKDPSLRREICSVLTKGTRRHNFLNYDPRDQIVYNTQEQSNLLVIKETSRVMDPKEMNLHGAYAEDGKVDRTTQYTFGICMVDCLFGKITLSQFDDCPSRQRLRTFLAEQNISEIVYEKKEISHSTLNMLKHGTSEAVFTAIPSSEEFPTADECLSMLETGHYFEKNKLPALVSYYKTAGPAGLQVLSALGGCVKYLQECLIDGEVLSMDRFGIYQPNDVSSLTKADPLEVNTQSNKSHKEENVQEVAPSSARTKPFTSNASFSEMNISDCFATQCFQDGDVLIMDHQALLNLEIMQNTFDGSRKGTLIEHMDRCVTPMGRRRLVQLICRPSMEPKYIKHRLDAVEELMAMDAEEDLCNAKVLLKSLPDLERLLQTTRALGLLKRVNNGKDEHPETRAVMYEGPKYNKRKIQDFVTLLKGFRTTVNVAKAFQGLVEKEMLNSKLLVSLFSDLYPDVDEHLSRFEKSFNYQQALQSGNISPSCGADLEWDDSLDEVKRCELVLEEDLKWEKKQLHCSSITFMSIAKDRYMLQVPDNVAKKIEEDQKKGIIKEKDYEFKSMKKGFRRFFTPTIKEHVAELEAAEAAKEAIRTDYMRRLFHNFGKLQPLWERVLLTMSSIDVLLSLASVSQLPGYCRPEVLEGKDEVPMLDLKEARHPCVEVSNHNFIPNSVKLGGADRGSLLLLSGPNMGGKSTLLRQTCLIVVMAQIGSFVPADVCTFTPVDRIYTRLGASDRILKGQSTFYVELSEASTILQQATSKSLVILDELGRCPAPDRYPCPDSFFPKNRMFLLRVIP
jgi:DNA mismatch repair protein MSH6